VRFCLSASIVANPWILGSATARISLAATQRSHQQRADSLSAKAETAEGNENTRAVEPA